jgi:hypothetical protein
MFAAILRRWRLVTPLVLAVLAISIVSGGMMMPASAHNIKFHFFGRAYAFDDIQPIPQTACDTGFLPLNGQVSLDTGHCFGGGGPGQPGQGVTGTFRLFTLFGEETVVSAHGNTTGKVVATADLEGSQDVCLTPNECFPTQAGCQHCSSTNVSSLLPGSLGEFTTCPNAGGGGQFGTGPFLAASPGVLFCSEDIIIQAVAKCHRRSDGSTQASVGAAITKFVNPAVDEDGNLEFIGSSNGEGGGSFGLPNETFTISGDQGGQIGTDANGNPIFSGHNGLPSFNILVTINEQIPFVDGDLGAISANAVHIVVTNHADLVIADFVIAHVFAGIHCAKHLGTEQNVGTLVDG